MPTNGFTDTVMIKHFVLLCIVSACILSCGNKDLEKIKVITQSGDLPVEVGSNVSISYTDSGFQKAILFAPLLERYATETRSETEMTKGITAYFYSREGKVNSFIKSKYAIRNERERTITARKEVQVVNNKGDTLRTEELIWDEKTDKIYSDKAVRITTPDKIIMGTGMVSNTAFTQFKVLNISGIINLNQ